MSDEKNWRLGGRAGCNAPHKIVEFMLPAGVALTLQVSADAGPSVKIAVSRAPGGSARLNPLQP